MVRKIAPCAGGGNSNYWGCQSTPSIRVFKRAKRHAPRTRSSRRCEVSAFRPPEPTLRFPIVGKFLTKSMQPSFLLTRLPVEIRLIIYQYVFEDVDNIVTIISKRKKLAHLQYPIPGFGGGREHRLCFDASECLPAKMVYGLPVLTKHQSSSGLIALLQTCRKVYTEAVDLLYSTISFEFVSSLTFVYFERAILPQHLHAISTLHTGWYMDETPSRIQINTSNPSYLPAHWDLMCRIILSMKGLQRLSLILFHSNMDKWALQDLLLAPLHGLKGLKVCHFQAVAGVGGGRKDWCSKKYGFPGTAIELSPFGQRIMAQATLPRD